MIERPARGSPAIDASVELLDSYMKVVPSDRNACIHFEQMPGSAYRHDVRPTGSSIGGSHTPRPGR